MVKYSLEKFKDIKAVLFDLDGTLLDTTEGILESAKFAAQYMGLEELPRETMLKFVGPPIQNSFMKFYGCNKEEAQKAANCFRDYYKTKALYKAKVYDGIYEVLSSLKKQGIKIGVATYKREDYAIMLLDYFEISKYCDSMHGADNYNKLTKADIVEICIEELGVNKKEVLLVGDTEHDAIGAEKAGVAFMGVTYGFGFSTLEDVNNYSNIAVANIPAEILWRNNMKKCEIEESINIAIAINDNYIMPCMVMLHSLLAKQKGRCIHLYLLYNDLNEKNRISIKKEAELYGHVVYEKYIDKSLFKDAVINKELNISIDAYYRLLLPYLIDVDKILWLDADIIVNGEISELYDIDISNVYAGAAIDAPEESGNRNEIKQLLGISNQIYFNSGILLLNTKKIREEIPQDKFWDIMKEYSNVIKYMDQDVLNKILGNQILLFDSKYNFQHHYSPEKSKNANKMLIIHYIWKKPWNNDYEGHLDGIFWKEAVEIGFRMKYIKYTVLKKIRYYKQVLYEYYLWVKRRIVR